jgi:trimethylamine--corrinoid protein Co-methyltransferase
MARGTLEFLGKDEMARIHDTSMRVLEEVGILVHSKQTRDMLVQAGAHASKDGSRLLLPEDLVESALSSAPKSILLAGRDKKHDLTIPSNDRMYVAPGGEGVYIKDLTNGQSRTADSNDLKNFAILSQALPQVDFFWPLVGALEQPVQLKGMTELKISMEHTVKHIQAMATSALEARQMVEFGCIFTGTPEALAKRPLFSAVECPISPLTFEQGLVEAQVELAKASIPVVAMSASVMGLTSPVTISGTIAQVNAENLASLVISQVAKKGAPFIYSSDSSPGDLKLGSIDYGALEATLVKTGMGQMGRRYGLPTMVCGIGLEDLSLSLANLWDGVPHLLTQSVIPSDLASGFGGIDQAAGASYEQFMVDAWVWDIAKEYTRPFDTSDEAISFETIRDASLDGSFLSKRHTAMRFRKEAVATRVTDAALGTRRAETVKGSLIKKAHEEVSKMLKRQEEPLTSKQESQAMEDYLKRMR